MDKIEKIRQEIKRRRLHFNKEAEKYQALNNGYSQNCYGARDALRDLVNFLYTLSEEPDTPEFPETFEICLYDGRTPDKEKCTECPTTCSVRKEEPDKSLDEAAEEKYPVYWKNYPKDGIVRSESSYDTNKQCRDAFIAGAEWQKKQMLKDAVEGRVFMSFAPGHNQMVMADVDLPTNTKVRIVVLKEEE